MGLGSRSIDFAYWESGTKDTMDKGLVQCVREYTPKSSYLRITVLLAKADAAANRYVSMI